MVVFVHGIQIVGTQAFPYGLMRSVWWTVGVMVDTHSSGGPHLRPAALRQALDGLAVFRVRQRRCRSGSRRTFASADDRRGRRRRNDSLSGTVDLQGSSAPLSTIQGQVSISPDRKRIVATFCRHSKALEIEIATGRVLTEFTNLHDLTPRGRLAGDARVVRYRMTPGIRYVLDP